VISDNVNDAIDLILSNKLISDSIVDEIKKRRATQSSRILVGISGNSRSGKSSFCHSMEQRLRAEGLTSLTIHLDDLIIPKQEREHPDNLIDRLQVRRYAEIVLACRRGKSYSIRSYCGLTGQKLVAPRVYDPGAHDVILIEGVLANHETVASLFDLRIHLSQREDVLRQRFEAYYAWRGYPPEEIEFLFGSRKESEWPVVLQQTQHVDFHFQL
jgi:pantothenate kinase